MGRFYKTQKINMLKDIAVLKTFPIFSRKAKRENSITTTNVKRRKRNFATRKSSTKTNLKSMLFRT